MPFCENCGKATEPGPLCDDCAQDKARSSDFPATPAPSGSAAAAPTARPTFGRRFLSDPAGALREVWVDRNLRPAWLAILWITLALFLAQLISDLILVYQLNLPTQDLPLALIKVLGRSALAPVTTRVALFLSALVLAVLARKSPSGQKTTYGKALAGFGAASIPFAVALTVYIPVSIALQFVLPGTVAYEILGAYPYVVSEPARIGAILLSLFACRAVTETIDDSRLAVGGVLLLVLQALVFAALGYLVGLGISGLEFVPTLY